MSFLSILATILALATFVGYIWLVVVAFKHSTLWGVLVLLLSPITAVIFAIKNWEDSKRPFLVFAGSSISAFAIGVYLVIYVSAPMMAMVGEANRGGELDPRAVAQSMNKVMDRMEPVGSLDAEDKAALGEMRRVLNEGILADAKSGAEETEVAAADRLVPKTPPNGPTQASAEIGVDRELTPTMSRDGYQSIPLTAASEYVGETVRVLERGGRELTGKLKSAHENRLTLEKSWANGTFAIEVFTLDVESLQVYTR